MIPLYCWSFTQDVRWLQMLMWLLRSSLSDSWFQHLKAWTRSIFAVKTWGHTHTHTPLLISTCDILSFSMPLSPVHHLSSDHSHTCLSCSFFYVVFEIHPAGAAVCSVDGRVPVGIQRQDPRRQQFPKWDPEHPLFPGDAKDQLQFQQCKCQRRKHQYSQSGVTTLP